MEGLKLFLCLIESGVPFTDRRRAVLYLHGATFPSALSIAHRFDGHSWRDMLCDAGFDVWGLDFHGFGKSDRYPEMGAPAGAHGPLCLAEDAAKQRSREPIARSPRRENSDWAAGRDFASMARR